MKFIKATLLPVLMLGILPSVHAAQLFFDPASIENLKKISGPILFTYDLHAENTGEVGSCDAVSNKGQPTEVDRSTFIQVLPDLNPENLKKCGAFTENAHLVISNCVADLNGKTSATVFFNADGTCTTRDNNSSNK